jgi:uncharacterized membrane protein YgcG
MGVMLYTNLVLTMSWKVALITRLWNRYHVLCFTVFSILFYYLGMLLVEIPADVDFLHSVARVYGEPFFWVLTLLVPVSCVVLDFTVEHVQRWYRPSPSDVLLEMETMSRGPRWRLRASRSVRPMGESDDGDSMRSLGGDTVDRELRGSGISSRGGGDGGGGGRGGGGGGGGRGGGSGVPSNKVGGKGGSGRALRRSNSTHLLANVYVHLQRRKVVARSHLAQLTRGMVRRRYERAYLLCCVLCVVLHTVSLC